jgi:PAS domain S-box-containing protein
MEQTSMNRELRVLMLEDTPNDAELAERELRKAGIVFTSMRVETRDAFISALEEFRPDIVLSDYKLPDFDGMTALGIVLRNHPEVPVIMVTGVLTDIEAVEFIHAGARDYILKERLARLGSAVRRTLAVEQGIRARKRAEIIAERERIRLQTILKTASDGIHILDCDGVLVEANDAFLSMLGLDHSAIGKLRVMDWEAQTSWTNSKARIDDLIAHHGKAVFETRHRRSDGVVLDVEINASGIEIDGKSYVYAASRDITERKRVERALVESEDRFKLFMDTLPAAVFIKDEEGAYIYVNRYVVDNVGERDWIGKFDRDIFPHELAEKIHADDLCALETGLVVAEEQIPGADGQTRLLETRKFRIPRQGMPPLLGGITLDFTEQRRNAEQYRSVIQASLDGYWVTDTSGRILEVNDSICRMHGYSREELLRMSISDIEADEPPEETAAHIREMVETGHVQFEARHKRKDGTIANVEVSVLYVATLGERFFVFIRDITTRKQAEAELRIAATAFESQEGMVITDASSVILRVNRAFTHITGYMAEESIGRKINLLKSDLHDAAFYAGMWETLLHQGSWQGEIMNRRKNGEVYPEWLTITAVKGVAGEVTHYVCTLTDITLRKAAAEKQHLRELSAHLQAVREEEKTNLAREIHDDLGSTLAALKIEAHLLNSGLSANQKTTPLFARVESMIDLLESAVAASRRIITDLRPTVLDDYGLLAAIQWQAGQFSKRTGIECRVTCVFSKDNCSKNCFGELDKTLSINLFRIFQEALTNAARHSGASKVEAEFRPGNNEVVLSIRDNGRGLPEGITIASTSFGIRGMRERVIHLGGEIGFDNLSGGGLSVTVRCPQNSNVGCPYID